MRAGRKAVCAALLLWLAFGFALWFSAGNVRAADNVEKEPDKETENAADITENVEKDLLERFDYSEINEALEQLFPEKKIDFGEAVKEMIAGKTGISKEFFKGLIKEQLFYAFSSCRKNLVQILIITLIAAVFQNFAQVFKSRQASEISFYVIYLLLVSLCLHSFWTAIEWVSKGLEKLTWFMTAFCPVYFLAVSIAKGSVTAVGFYNLALLFIYLVEVVIVCVLLPCIHIYIMVKILDFLSLQENLSKFAELIETAVSWILKTLLACVLGLNVVQGMISPAIDAVKRSAVTRTAEAVPGVGDAIGGVTEVVLGTAVLVKNGIGAVGMFVCLALCIVPLVQVGCIALMYKLAAAVVQPVSDKRTAGCIDCVGDGCRLLMQVVFTAGVLFLLTIVIVSFVTAG